GQAGRAGDGLHSTHGTPHGPSTPPLLALSAPGRRATLPLVFDSLARFRRSWRLSAPGRWATLPLVFDSLAQAPRSRADQDPMTRPPHGGVDHDGRHVSGATIHALLLTLRGRGGDEAVRRALELAGRDPGDAARLADPSAWISYWEAQALLEAGA